jgi:hypothetical protein
VGKETGAAVGLDVEVAILGRMNRSRQRIKPHERWKGLKKSLARQKKKRTMGLWPWVDERQCSIVRGDCWAVHSDLQQCVSGNGSTNGGRGSVRAAPAVCWVTGNVSAVPGSLVGRRREGSSGSLPWAVSRIYKFSGERRDMSACLELRWCWVARLDLRREWVTPIAVGQRCGVATLELGSPAV